MKNINLLKITALCFCSYFLFSCEREIDLELDGAGETIVIEGAIFEDELPFLSLSRTFSFYDELNQSGIDSLFIRNADIQMTVDGKSVTLEEINFYVDEDSTALVSIYAPNFNDPSVYDFVGQRGKTYQLSGTVNDKSFSASTYLPNQTPIDSIWYKSHPQADTYPDLVQLFVKSSDADTVGNHYRIYTQRNSEPFYTESGSVFDDLVINGSEYEVSVNRALAPFSDEEIDFETYGYFAKGDTITARRCGIDDNVFQFYTSMEYIASGGGGPFGSATILYTNIEGDDFTGIWGAYSIEDASIIVPE